PYFFTDMGVRQTNQLFIKKQKWQQYHKTYYSNFQQDQDRFNFLQEVLVPILVVVLTAMEPAEVGHLYQQRLLFKTLHLQQGLPFPLLRQHLHQHLSSLTVLQWTLTKVGMRHLPEPTGTPKEDQTYLQILLAE
ncbi:MAG: hypothetical protein ACD_50C00109G0001, partial [uncultured bacterium]